MGDVMRDEQRNQPNKVAMPEEEPAYGNLPKARPDGISESWWRENLERHPILREAFNLTQAIEGLGASEKHTAACTQSTALASRIADLLDVIDELNARPNLEDFAVDVVGERIPEGPLGTRSATPGQLLMIAERDEARAALQREKEKNLLDRKLYLFLTGVQTWLGVAGAPVTPCKAAEVYARATLVSPAKISVVELDKQICDFCKFYLEHGTLPEWAQAGA